MSDYEIVCHGVLKAKRFKVKPYLDGCISEEYKEATCPTCGCHKVTYNRKFKDISVKGYGRLKAEKAKEYLFSLEYMNRQVTEIFEKEYKIPQGSKGAMGFVFGVNTPNGQYAEDFNGTRTLIKKYSTNPISNTIQANFSCSEIPNSLIAV